MCGRMVNKLTGEVQISFFEIQDIRLTYRPERARFNIAPTTTIGLVRENAAGERKLVAATWGLRPPWVRSGERRPPLHNARCETVHSLNSFRSAFKSRRCLVPASGYFEWRRADKQPFYFSRQDEHPLAFAGIYEVSPDGQVSCAIVTTMPNTEAAVIHDRMPVILRREFWARWFAPNPLSDHERSTMLVPAPNGTLAVWPVDRAVGSVRNDNPGLILPQDATPRAAEPPDMPLLFTLDSM